MKNCPFCNCSFKSRNNAQRFCSTTCANRFNLNGLKQVSMPIKGVELAELVGIVLGDGDLTKYQLKVTLNTIADKNYLPFVASLFAKLFPEIPAAIMPRENAGCTVVRLNSRIVVDFIKDMGIVSGKPLVPRWIFEKPEYIKACIRGLVDTEGCVSFKLYHGRNKISVYRQLTFTNRNDVLLRFVIEQLELFGFKCTKSRIKNIYLSNDYQIDKYREEIGFSNPKLEYRSLIRNYESYLAWRGVRAV